MEQILKKAEETLLGINKPMLSQGDIVYTIDSLKELIVLIQKEMGIYVEPTGAKIIKMYP